MFDDLGPSHDQDPPRESPHAPNLARDATRFLRQRAAIEQAIRTLGRRSGLNREQTAEFTAWVFFRIVRNRYAAVRAFRGSSRASTYWHAVVRNLLRDWLNRRFGKWRPSAYTRRLGTDAQRLERLVQRDGFTVDEAIEILRRNHQCRCSDAELYEIAAALPRRAPLRRFEPIDEMTLTSHERDPQDRAEDDDRQRNLQRVQLGLAQALAELDPEDRRVLELVFVEGLTIAAAARRLQLSQRRLYARRDRCLARLRQSLVRQHVDWPDVEPIVGWEQAELQSFASATG